jgi:protein TonB
MKHRLDHPGLDALVLPDDLKSLDAELSSIRYEERPSFGPELEGELAKAWLTRTPAQRPWARRLAVAAVIALLLVGTTVPSARASLVRFIGTLQTEEVAPVEGPEVTVPAEAAPQPVDSSDAIVELRPPVIAEVVPVEVPTPPIEVPVEWPAPTLPVLVDREEAEASIREAYPLDLQRAGVGGSVRVLLWIDPRGSVDNVNLDEGSGVPALDRAALLVAPSFRFRPASRRGQSVGTWVEFDVIFQPMAQQFGQIAGVGDGAASDPNIFDPLRPRSMTTRSSRVSAPSSRCWWESPLRASVPPSGGRM